MGIQYIRSVIHESGLSQAEICRRAAMRPATLCEIYTGRTPRPRHATLVRIARALGVDAHDFVERARAIDHERLAEVAR